MAFKRSGVDPAPVSQPSLIFDFDGTIANTLPLVIDLFHEWAVVDMKLDNALIEELRGMSAQQVLKKIGVPLHKLPGFITKGRKELRQRFHQVKPFEGMGETIKKLSDEYTLYVMSSNSNENINRFLKTYGLDQYFKKVYGSVSIFGKTKVMKKIIKQENLDKEQCWYIGDETRDVEATHKIDLKIASVTWGYNNKKILSTYSPELLIDTPSQLYEALHRA